MINRKELDVVRNKTYLDKIRTIKRQYPGLTEPQVRFVLHTFGINFIEVKEYDTIMACVEKGLTVAEISRILKKSIAWTNSTISASPSLHSAYKNMQDTRARKKVVAYNPKNKRVERLKLIESMGYAVDYATKSIPLQLFYDLSEEELLDLGIPKSEIAKRKPLGSGIKSRRENINLDRLRELLLLGTPRFEIRDELNISDSMIDKYRKIFGIPSNKERNDVLNEIIDNVEDDGTTVDLRSEQKEKLVISRVDYLRMEVMTAKKDGVGVPNIARLLNITEDEVLEILAKERTTDIADVANQIKKNNMNINIAHTTFGINVDDLFKYFYEHPELDFFPVDAKQKYKGYLRMRQIHKLFKEDGYSVGDIAEIMDVTPNVIQTEIKKAFPHPSLTSLSLYDPRFDFDNWASLNLVLLDTVVDPDQIVKVTGLPLRVVKAAKKFIDKLDNMDIGKYVKYHYVYQNKLNGGI